VDFDEEDVPSLLKLIEMERYLQRLLRKKVDVVMKSGIHPEPKEIILEEVIYV
jgi:predicted nucleotidyltransferase